MSSRHNQERSAWSALLSRLRTIESTWRGIPLTPRDHQTWTEAILMTGLVLHDLSNQFEGFGSHRDHVLWCINATHTDVAAMANFLSEVIGVLRETREPHEMTYSSLKRRVADITPNSGALLAPARGALERFFGEPSPDTLRAPYQFFSFLTRLTLVDIDMSTQLEDEYVGTEERVSQLHLPNFLCDRLNEIMKEWFRGYRLESQDFRPKHGPGGVAELPGDISLFSKYRTLAPDQLLSVVFRMCAQIDLSTYLPLDPVGTTSRTSRVVFVAKSMKTKRVISAEPTTLQYFQQGVKASIDRWVRQSPEISQHIDLSNQELQRDLALSASRTQRFATVDLSAASDSVSYELVKRVFRGTALYPFLVATRSRAACLPSGRVVGLTKFAPMGSALCFPVETLIFACVAEWTARYVRQTTGQTCSVYRVYGDDIIVEEPCLRDLVSNLRLLGFIPNMEKTFSGTARFRESCGCDAYDGVDVTPMRIGRSFSSGPHHVRSPGRYLGTIAMANSAYGARLWSLREWLIGSLLSAFPSPPLFSQDGDCGLLSWYPTNHRCRTRWRKDYQRQEIQVMELTSVRTNALEVPWDQRKQRFEPDPASEVDGGEVALYEWLRLAAERPAERSYYDDDYLITITIGKAATSLGRHWKVAS